jgi:hypothetical protein
VTAQPRGPKFVAGRTESGQVVLTRDDDTTHALPVVMFTGTLVDNGDGTSTLTTLDEE